MNDLTQKEHETIVGRWKIPGSEVVKLGFRASRNDVLMNRNDVNFSGEREYVIVNVGGLKISG